jgi:hypothetical protein
MCLNKALSDCHPIILFLLIWREVAKKVYKAYSKKYVFSTIIKLRGEGQGCRSDSALKAFIKMALFDRQSQPSDFTGWNAVILGSDSCASLLEPVITQSNLSEILDLVFFGTGTSLHIKLIKILIVPLFLK